MFLRTSVRRGGRTMVDLIRQLSDDADDIVERYRRDVANAVAERDLIKTRLAELDEIERTAGHLATRLSALKNESSTRPTALPGLCSSWPSALTDAPISLRRPRKLRRFPLPQLRPLFLCSAWGLGNTYPGWVAQSLVAGFVRSNGKASASAEQSLLLIVGLFSSSPRPTLDRRVINQTVTSSRYVSKARQM